MGKFSDNTMAAIVWDEVGITLGTLGSATVTGNDSKIDTARAQGFRVLRTEWFIIMDGLTQDEGPILVGLAHDLGATEIDECIEADPQRPNDPAVSEKANRPVWPLTYLWRDSAGNGQIVDKGVIKLNWSIQEGTLLKWWAKNTDASALTTGAIVKIRAKHFGVWLKD